MKEVPKLLVFAFVCVFIMLPAAEAFAEKKTPIEELQKKVRVYADGEEPKLDLVPGGDKPLQNFAPRGMAYWELLHAILQEEDVHERDRFFMYWAHTLGIERGKPFNPTEPFFDQSWKLPQIEEVDFAKYSKK